MEFKKENIFGGIHEQIQIYKSLLWCILRQNKIHYFFIGLKRPYQRGDILRRRICILFMVRMRGVKWMQDSVE